MNMIRASWGRFSRLRSGELHSLPPRRQRPAQVDPDGGLYSVPEEIQDAKTDTKSLPLGAEESCRVCKPVSSSARPQKYVSDAMGSNGVSSRCSSVPGHNPPTSLPKLGSGGHALRRAHSVLQSVRAAADDDDEGGIPHRLAWSSAEAWKKSWTTGSLWWGGGYAVTPSRIVRWWASMPGTRSRGFADRRPMPDLVAHFASMMIWAEGSLAAGCTAWWGITVRRALKGCTHASSRTHRSQAGLVHGTVTCRHCECILGGFLILRAIAPVLSQRMR